MKDVLTILKHGKILDTKIFFRLTDVKLGLSSQRNTRFSKTDFF